MTDTTTPSESAARPPKRGWLRWAVPVAAFVAGASLGFAAAGGDPRESEEYLALQGELESAEKEAATAEERAEQAESDAGKAAQTAAETIREAEEMLTAKAAELDQREQAVAAVEQRIVATSIAEGTWTVGVDVEPGTYRTARPVGSDCYWGIYRSGSNGSDIIDNGIPGGGHPMVTLSEGQDFVNNRCGTFVKQ
jgi:hypothetical protein